MGKWGAHFGGHRPLAGPLKDNNIGGQAPQYLGIINIRLTLREGPFCCDFAGRMGPEGPLYFGEIYKKKGARLKPDLSFLIGSF